MPQKPTYKELEQKVQKLENKVLERSKAQAALLESEAKYRNLVEQLPSAIYLAAIDESSTTLFISPQVEEILGFKPDEWKKNHDIWLMQIHSDDRERVLAEVEASHKSKSPFLSEYRMIRRDGRTIWVRDQAKIVKDDAGRPLFLQGMFSDITERKLADEALQKAHDELERRVEERTVELMTANKKLSEEIEIRRQAEEALRESEEHLRSFMKSAKGFAVYRLRTDPENYYSGHVVFVSPTLEDAIGVSPQKEFSEWFKHVHEDDFPSLIKAQMETIRTGAPFDRQFRFKNSDGELRWVHAISNPVFDSEGNPEYYNGILVDVTREKEAEKALQKSERHLRALIENASNFAVYRLITDRDNPNLLRVIFVSPSIMDIMGVSDPMCFEAWFEHIHPDDEERIIRANIEAFKTKRFDETMRVYHPQKNAWVWIHAVSTGFEDPEQGCAYVNGILIDITRQEEAREALLESDQRMDLAMAGGNIGLWDLNPQAGEVFLDPRSNKNLGYSGDNELNLHYWKDLIHPEDLAVTQQMLKDSLSGKTPFYENEARWKFNSGQWKWMLVRGKVMARDENGKALRMIGTYQDINDRKLMETDLLRKTLRLEETNTALRVLLRQREKDKEELEENVLSNVKNSVEPYLKELKAGRLDQRQTLFLDLLESGLMNITSPFCNKLTSDYLGLTPGELQIAYLIREGKRTKEIAELLNLSSKTIEGYRKNLRKKLGLTNAKANLRTHLLSIDK